MKKGTFLLFSLMTLGSVAIAQNSTVKKAENVSIYTSLKPADMRPAVFSSQEDLDAKIQDKKNNALAAIRENAGDSVKVRKFRELLWRFENAIVKSPNSK